MPMIYHSKDEKWSFWCVLLNYHGYWARSCLSSVRSCFSLEGGASSTIPVSSTFDFLKNKHRICTTKNIFIYKILEVTEQKKETNETFLCLSLENDQSSRRTLPNPRMLQSPGFFDWDNVVFLFRGWYGPTYSAKKPSTANFQPTMFNYPKSKQRQIVYIEERVSSRRR